MLCAVGVGVFVGVLVTEVVELNDVYLKFKCIGRLLVVVKVVVLFDGWMVICNCGL